MLQMLLNFLRTIDFKKWQSNKKLVHKWQFFHPETIIGDNTATKLMKRDFYNAVYPFD